jgi:hypothetical protein
MILPIAWASPAAGLPVFSEDRAMFAGLLQHIFGLQAAADPGAHPAELGVVSSAMRFD